MWWLNGSVIIIYIKNKKTILDVGYGLCGSSSDLICESPEPSILFEGVANAVVYFLLSLE